jgi:hypothetical protein
MAREPILLLAAIPADLRAALAERFDLVENQPARIAVTTAMAGLTEAQLAGWKSSISRRRRGAASPSPTRPT